VSHRFIEGCPRNPIITGKCNQLLDVLIIVVPQLDRVRKIVGPPWGIVRACCIGSRLGQVTVELAGFSGAGPEVMV